MSKSFIASLVILIAALCSPSLSNAQFIPKRVIDRITFLDPEAIPRQWKRATDPLMGQVFLLIASDNSACLVSPSDFVMAIDGEAFKCEWRQPRGF